MQRVAVEDADSKFNMLLIGFFTCFCCCLIMGMCALSEGTNSKGPFVVDTYHPTKCIVEHPTGNYEFDDRWHVPSGGPRDQRVDCMDAAQVLNTSNSRITMDEVVYAFIIPRNGNMTGVGKRGFDRWILTLNAYLLLDVVFRENRSEDLHRSKLTYEVRMGYQDRINNGNQYWMADTTLPRPDNKWNTVFETTETRLLQCYLYKSGKVKGIKYGCNLIPFFTLFGVYHNHYLINIRFPNDFVGNTVFNSDVQYIQDLQLILRHQTASFTRNYNLVKIMYYPLTIGVFVWFYRRLNYRPLLVIEKSCLFLGFSLVLLDTPLEFVAIYEEFPFMPLYNYGQEVLFIASLTLFCASFFGQFIKARLEFKGMVFYVFYLSPLNLYFLVFLTDVYERFVQMKNPFFSIWDSISGFRHLPEFNVFSAIFSAFYLLVITFQFNTFYSETVIKQKIVLRTRGNHLNKGGMKALRFLMFGVYIITLLTVFQFMYFQIEKSAFKLMGPTDKLVNISTSSYLTAFLVVVFGMWNIFTYSFLILYAPPGRYDHEEHEEMDIVEQEE